MPSCYPPSDPRSDSLCDGKLTSLYLWGIGYELSNIVLNLVPHAPIDFSVLRRQSIDGIGVNDTPVSKMEREGEYRTSFFGRITDGDHVAEPFFHGLRDALRLLARDVDAYFLHNFTCQSRQRICRYHKTPSRYPYVIFRPYPCDSINPTKLGNSLEPTPRTWSVAGRLFCLRAQFDRASPNLSTYKLGNNRSYLRARRLRGMKRQRRLLSALA